MQIDEIQQNTTNSTSNLLEINGCSDTGEKEVWKDIKDYEKKYQISNLGNVKSMERNRKTKQEKTAKLPERIMKPSLTNHKKESYKYKYATLCKNSVYKSFLVHRLVAQAFIPNPESLPCVNHKNFNKLDNDVNNLEWVTYKQNTNHAIKNDKMAYLFGENSRMTHLTKDKVNLIRFYYLTKIKTTPELCKLFKICSHSILNIVKNKTWKDDEYEVVSKSKFFTLGKYFRNKGHTNGNSKLTYPIANLIRDLYEKHEYSSLKLAKIFGVAKGTILSILHNRTWNNT